MKSIICLIVFLVWFPFFNANASFIKKEGLVENERGWFIWKEFRIGQGIAFWALEMIQPKTAQAEELSLQDRILNKLTFVAEKYGLNKKIFIGVAECESEFNPMARGDYRSETGEYMANGIFQFWEKTFNIFREESGILKLNYNDWKSQIELAGWAFSKDYAYHWKNCWQFVRKQYGR